jgi:type IV pilus assembly protein PilW
MSSSNSKVNRGFSLVELMVGLAVGAVAILVVTQLALTFEAQKRSTVGSAESMDEGAVALYSLSRELQGAGYGIIDQDLIGCNIRAHLEVPGQPAGAQDLFFSIFPVRIIKGAAGVPDSIMVNSSNSPMVSAAVTLTTSYPGDLSNFRLSERYGFEAGDAIIVAEPLSIRQATIPSRNCSMHQVTALPTAAGETNDIEHKLTKYTNALGQPNQDSKYNSAAGLGSPDYAYKANSTKVFNLGNTPTVITYTACTADSPRPPLGPCTDQNNGQMIAQSNLGGNPVVLLENVIAFRAQYGMDMRPGPQTNLQVTTYSNTILDADGDGITTAFDGAGLVTTNDPDDYMRVGAVRMAIVVRSKYPDNPNTPGSCTSALPNWGWDGISAAEIADGLPAGANWQCYKYKVFQTVAPLRNMLWRVKAS